MNDSVLSTVSNYTYLGVNIRSKFIWAVHMSGITSKANIVDYSDCHDVTCTVVPQKLRKLHINPMSDQGWNTSQVSDTPYHQDHKKKFESV